MGVLGTIVGLPIAGPLLGLGWLARRIAEAAEQEMNNPARIEADLLALESLLEDGEIDEATYEAREAVLLVELETLRSSAEVVTASATADQAPEG
jgi:hypothetical protein